MIAILEHDLAGLEAATQGRNQDDGRGFPIYQQRCLLSLLNSPGGEGVVPEGRQELDLLVVGGFFNLLAIEVFLDGSLGEVVVGLGVAHEDQFEAHRAG